jgi:hypothetical protein
VLVGALFCNYELSTWWAGVWEIIQAEWQSFGFQKLKYRNSIGCVALLSIASNFVINLKGA